MNTTRAGMAALTLMITLGFVGCSTSKKKTAAKPALSLMAAQQSCGGFDNTSGSISCVGS